MFGNRDHNDRSLPSTPGGRSLFLAGSSIFDIHTIALSNCVLCMVDVMISRSWYRQNISTEVLSGIHLFYLSYQYNIYSKRTVIFVRNIFILYYLIVVMYIVD